MVDRQRPASAADRDLDLGALAEEVSRILAAGEPVDARSLARRFHVSPDEVGDCVAVVGEMKELLVEEAETGGRSPEGDLPLPELPDDYELLEEIGRGGMGVVYRARQRSLDRVVAVKVMRPGELQFAHALARFQREAQSLARLRHRHIVSVHEVGSAGGHVYYTMDLIEGVPLSRLLERGPLTVARTVRLLRQVASAIAYVHAHGLIHRDLKPANVLVDAVGDAHVVDFGLARDAAASEALTSAGNILGTPQYMAPEQALGDLDRIGEACDVYALGAILYECLTGRAPFAGQPLVQLVQAVLNEEPRPPRKLNRRVPPDLEIVCLKAMAKAPERRYPTMRALLEDLELSLIHI